MTTTVKPAGRTLAEFQPLKPAEQKLLSACRQGTLALISDKRPDMANDDNTVRAAFLRFLTLGGDEQAPVHEHGVQLSGAWIEGELDMEAARVSSNLVIWNCRFNITPVFRGTKIAGALNLSGCQLPGLAGDGLACDGGLFLRQVTTTGKLRLLGVRIGGDLSCESSKFNGKEGDALAVDGAVIKGSVFMNEGFTATGKVRLLGAQIGGALSCEGSKFDGKEGAALSADGAVIKGDVFMDQGFVAAGEVRLLGIQIGGNLSCGGAKLDGKEGCALSADGAVIKGDLFMDQGFTVTGEVRLVGAQIGGNFSCSDAKFGSKEGDALSAEGMVVEGTFFFRNLLNPVNGVSLSSSHVGRLADDANSWGERLILDSFIYDSIVGGAPTDATTRLAWLDKQLKAHAGLDEDDKGFRPQPWRQLAKVLREMGHAEDARQVAIAFEHRLREANLIGQTPKHWGKLRAWLNRNINYGGHWLFWVLTGYGYRPLRLLVWMLGVWLVCAAIYWCAAFEGVFAPSNPLVFQNPAYDVCRADHMGPDPVTTQGAGNWYLCEKLPEEYSGFSPLAYSLDVILPLVDLQQETAWSPLIPTPKNVWYQELLAILDWKHITRLVLWLEILFGWVSSLLLVAVVSGLTKRREE